MAFINSQGDMMIRLDRKRILVICPTFFDYSRRLKNELQLRGAEVVCWDERPGNSALHKILIRKQSKLIENKINRYYADLVKKTSIDFDYILCVGCETETESVLKLLSASYPHATMILYLWDSIRNTPGISKKYKYFDKCFSFDRRDIEENPFLKYAYWGFTSEFREADTKEYEYDLCFIGTAHSMRPYVLNSFRDQCNRIGLKYYFYIYQNNLLVYLYNKLRNPYFKYIHKSDVEFKPVSQAEMLEIYSKSRAILDISSVNQSGMTTRIGEMIGLHKKIVTNNFDDSELLRKYPENFSLYDTQKPVLDRSFFETDYRAMSDEDEYKYSFDNFLNLIFGE